MMEIMMILGLLSVVSSLGVMMSESSISSALNLICVFINVCGVMICMKLETLGILLIIIYVGAVGILFLFVIMMVGESVREEKNRTWLKYMVSVIVLVIVWMNGVAKESEGDWRGIIEMLDRTSNVKVIGEYLFTENIGGVIGVGILLLVGIIGGVVLGRRWEEY